MSSYPYPSQREDYYNSGYENEQLYDDDYETSTSSFGNAMTATNFSQSMSSTSSYAPSPSSWGWHAQQQQSPYSMYNTTPSFSAPENQEYIQSRVYSQQQPQSLSESQEYVDRLRYATQQQPPTQDLSPNQRSGGSGSSSPPRELICLHPSCETCSHFKRKADLDRHMNTVHNISQRWSCPQPHCDRKGDRGFSRKDHFYEHLQIGHGRCEEMRRHRR